jgi:hypothetical protein
MKVKSMWIAVVAILLFAGSAMAQMPGPWGGGNPGSGGGAGWGCGPGWSGGNGMTWSNGMWGGNYGRHNTQFMALAKVVAIDTQASAITVTLEGASPNLLTKLGLTNTDLPTNVDLQTASKVNVWGCGWHKKKWGSGRTTLASAKQGDIVNLMGYFDKTTGDPVVSQINVWFF